MKINFFRSALNLQRKPNTVTDWWLRSNDENYAQLAAVQRVKRLQKQQKHERFYWTKKLQTSFIFVAVVIFILTLIKAVERRQTHTIDHHSLSIEISTQSSQQSNNYIIRDHLPVVQRHSFCFPFFILLFDYCCCYFCRWVKKILNTNKRIFLSERQHQRRTTTQYGLTTLITCTRSTDTVDFQVFSVVIENQLIQFTGSNSCFSSLIHEKGQDLTQQ